jgi:dTDP-glucose 4,6-dehydratase
MRTIATADLDEVVSRTDDVFRGLSGARLFLTGATGFFGVWLVSALAHAKRLRKRDIAVTILSRDPAAARARYGSVFDDAGAEWIAGDARSFAIPSGTFSHVVHGATAASAAMLAETPLEMFDVIVGGTQRALELAEASGCKRFLFLSSGAVYGRQPPERANLPETYGGAPSPIDPKSAYGEGKRAAELMCMLHASRGGFDAVAARGYAFVGPHLPLDLHFAIGNFVRDALAGGPIRILGDGTPYRSYLYGTDLAHWLWTMLARGRAGAAYNVGSGDGRPLKAIAERVAAIAGVKLEIAKTAPPGHVAERYVPDVTLAKKELGLEVTVDLDEAIRRTLAWSGFRHAA